MKTKNKIILILNIIAFLVLLFPLKELDLFSENYSTLTLNFKGYLYVLFVTLYISFILGYESYLVNGKRAGINIFVSTIMGALIPHHVPYNLQGNLHLFFAYLSLLFLSLCTLSNLLKKTLIMPKLSKSLINLFIFSLVIAYILYLYAGMINTLSEIIYMYTVLFIHFYLLLACNK